MFNDFHKVVGIQNKKWGWLVDCQSIFYNFGGGQYVYIHVDIIYIAY